MKISNSLRIYNFFLLGKKDISNDLNKSLIGIFFSLSSDKFTSCSIGKFILFQMCKTEQKLKIM